MKKCVDFTKRGNDYGTYQNDKMTLLLWNGRSTSFKNIITSLDKVFSSFY